MVVIAIVCVRMETELYDDIFIQDKENNYETSDLDDLYGNIHIPEAAETAVQKLKSLTDDHEKVKSQNSQLKQQVKILMNKNEELNTKCCNYEYNKSQISTSLSSSSHMFNSFIPAERFLPLFSMKVHNFSIHNSNCVGGDTVGHHSNSFWI